MTTASLRRGADLLDLHGVRVEDALDRLESFLDRAVVAGLDRVAVLHGKGTGRVRDAIRAATKRHRLVSTIDASDPGVTRIRLS